MKGALVAMSERDSDATSAGTAMAQLFLHGAMAT
jgi:hypothetical protein